MRLVDLLEKGFAGREPAVLVTGSVEIILEQALRWLPGRRLTARAQWKGKAVVVKAFSTLGKGLGEYRREVRALGRLHEQGVAAPACLHHEQNQEGALLILEQLQGITAAEQLTTLGKCEGSQRDARLALILDLATWVSAQHRRGVLQRDIHLDNFFLQNGQWYLLDAAACRFAPVSKATAKRNLAKLLAQFDPLDIPPRDALKAALLAAPASRMIHLAQTQRCRHMLKKTLRECTEFSPVHEGSLRGMSRRDAQPLLTELLNQHTGVIESLDAVMLNADMLKDGGSATVVALPTMGWVIKRYNVKGRFHRLKRQFGRTRAKNAWLAGYFLRALGVATPLPIAFLEERKNGLVGRCWLITSSVAGQGLDRYPADRSLEPCYRRPLLEFFSLMKRFGFAHGDMKASNVLLAEQGVSIIDLDAFRRYRFSGLAAAARARDQARLLRNWPAESLLRRDLLAGLQKTRASQAPRQTSKKDPSY